MKLISATARLLGLPLVLMVVWWLATREGDNFFVPAPDEVLTTFVDVWGVERLTTDVVPSMARLAAGLAATIVVGIGGGVLIGSVTPLRYLLEPVLEFLRAIPPTVMVPVLLLLIGINDTMKVAVILAGSVWPVLLNTIDGVRGIDEVVLDTARSYRFTKAQRVRYVILPGAAPRIMAGVRQALSIGLILMVVSEMFAASEGLGFAIVQFQRLFAIPAMWSGILLLSLIGVLLALLFHVVERRVLAWYYGSKEISNAR